MKHISESEKWEDIPCDDESAIRERQEFALKAVRSQLDYYKKNYEWRLENGYSQEDAQEYLDEFTKSAEELMRAIKDHPDHVIVGMPSEHTLVVGSNMCEYVVRIEPPKPEDEIDERWNEEELRIQYPTIHPYKDVAALQTSNRFALSALTQLLRYQKEKGI